MSKYDFMSLKDIKKYIDDMEKLQVSKVARGKDGFLTHYIKIDGDKSKLNNFWIKKRNAFIARTLPLYLENRTYRRGLSLIAWAYDIRKI
jgi:hypothetical protein